MRVTYQASGASKPFVPLSGQPPCLSHERNGFDIRKFTGVGFYSPPSHLHVIWRPIFPAGTGGDRTNHSTPRTRIVAKTSKHLGLRFGSTQHRGAKLTIAILRSVAVAVVVGDAAAADSFLGLGGVVVTRF